MATNDTGPLRHRYGGMRDLVVGVTVVLSDGTVAQSGGKVIKNVAGYDLAKLFTGSFGTLGLIVKVAVRLHPAPTRTATLTARGNDPATLAAAARRSRGTPARGGLPRRRPGRATKAASTCASAVRPHPSARTAAAKHVEMPTEVEDDDEELWARQRARQRGGRGREGLRAARPTSRP